MVLMVHYSDERVEPVHLQAGEQAIFGRDSDECTVVLLGKGVSRCHCRLSFVGVWAWIEDLGSANGTYVNGERVHSCPCRKGDVITIGDRRIEIT